MKSRLSWFGTVTSVIGSFAVALGFMLAGYAAFILGSISWLIVGYVGRNKPLIVLNGFFLTANMIGVYRALFY